MNTIAVVLLASIAVFRPMSQTLTKPIFYLLVLLISLVFHWPLIIEEIRLNSLLTLVLMLVFLFRLGEGIKLNLRDFRIILLCGCTSSLVAFFGIGEVIPGGMFLGFRYFGLLGDTLSLVIIILAFYFRDNLRYFDIGYLIVYALLTGSKTIFTLLPLLLWYRFDRFYKILLPFFLFPFLYSLDYSSFIVSFLTRWNGVLVAVEILELYPFGVGFNNSTLMFNTIYDYASGFWLGNETEQIDSGYLRLLVEHGFVFGFLMIAVVIRRIRMYPPRVALLLVLIPLMNYPFEFTSALFPIYFLVDFSQETL